MSPRVLGISSDFHDSAAAVVSGGTILAAAAEERFSYQKHDPSFPALAIEACLRQSGCDTSAIDAVAYHENPAEKLSRVMASRMRDFPRGFFHFARSMREMALGQLWVKMDVFKNTGIRPDRVHYVPHHLSHAAYAFCTSPYQDAAVLVLDAVGEWTSTSSFRASRKNGKLEILPLGTIPYPHSLGMVYSAFTGFLGFRINDAECSTMALAAFGRPRYADRVQKILRAQSDGSYEVDPDYFDYSDPNRLPISAKFRALFGEPRHFRSKLPFSIFSDGAPASIGERDQFYADVAASLQAVLEETVLALCAKLRVDSGCENLCLAGGVALNATMNGRIARESQFRSVSIPPDPGDGGGAAGAALFLESTLGQAVRQRSSVFTPYLGCGYPDDPAGDLVPSLRFGEWHRYRLLPSVLGEIKAVKIEQFSENRRDDLASSVVEDLRAGKIVGWVQGRFENGPRALGNRSLLIDPANRDAARRLSRNVKLRAPFRPYACSLRSSRASALFKVAGGVPPAMRWMASTHPVHEEARATVSQALHVDGTTRPQLVEKEENPRYDRLLEVWEDRTGNPALLNTSFNESGFPMVSSPIDAILMFARTDIQTLVLGDQVLRKET